MRRDLNDHSVPEGESPPSTCWLHFFGCTPGHIWLSGLQVPIAGSHWPTSSTKPPRFFSSGLLSNHSLPSLCLCFNLHQPRCRTLRLAWLNILRFSNREDNQTIEIKQEPFNEWAEAPYISQLLSTWATIPQQHPKLSAEMELSMLLREFGIAASATSMHGFGSFGKFETFSVSRSIPYLMYCLHEWLFARCCLL